MSLSSKIKKVRGTYVEPAKPVYDSKPVVKLDKTVDPSFKNTESFGRIPTPTIKSLPTKEVEKDLFVGVNKITRDKGTPSIKEATQRQNAKDNIVEAKVEKETKLANKVKSKRLEIELSDKYGIDVKRANSPIEAVNILSLVDDDQKEQFKKDFEEYSLASERSNPFRAGAEAGFNVLPTNLEKTAGKEDVQTAKGYGAGRLVGGIGQQLAFNSVLGPGIESLTSKLLPKATPFVAETIKDVAIGTGTQLAEAPFDKPTAGQFAGNIAIDIALNALFGVVGKGLSKVDLSNIKTAKPSQVVGDVAQKLNVSIVEADKLVDDAIDFYVNQSGVADTKLFEQLQLEAPKNVNSDAIGMRLSEKVKTSNVVNEIQSKTLLHGTNADFKEFDLNKTGSFTGNDGLYGTGVYLTENPTYAKVYGENVIQTKPNVKKPFVIDREVDLNEISRITGQPIPTNGIYSDKASDMISVNPRQFSEELQKLGYDSVVVKGGPNQTIEEMVVFDTKNISTVKPQLDKPSDFSVKKPIYPTLDTKFAKERPRSIQMGVNKTVDTVDNIASKVESPTITTKVDNVASKFEGETLTSGDNVLTSGEIKERGFSENIRTDKNRVDELRKEFDENPEFYETLSNKTTLESAQARFDRGYDEAVKDFRATSDTIRADNVPLAKLIADEAVKRGDMETAREVVVKAAESLTKAGQFSQAAKILRETNDPITVMRFVNNEIKKLNTQGSKRYGKGWENIKLDEIELNLIAKITKDTSDEQKEEVFQQIFDSMVKRIPTTKREKFDAWRRIAMLFNPKTHVRNTLGNGLMRGLKTIADKQAQVMELTIPKELRTKGFATKELKEVSKNYFDSNKKTLLEGSRWEIFGVASPFSEKRIFKNQFLESLNDISKKTLEGEDIFFFKSNFISDLAGFMNARGLKEPTEEAVAYALRRSQEATFRQANAVANAINTMKGSRIGLLVDAAIPFTKTPANILQTGIDYSPIGAMKSVVQILNKAEPQVAIENLSKGLTGTGLALIGAWASYNGLARGAYEKSNKVEGLYQATGMLPNSIKTPGGSYTIDWAQPIAMPFFMGVAFMDELKKGGQTKADAAFNALLQSGETLVQQSMLSGVKDLFGGYGTMTEKIIQLPINYMTQGFPTVGGQIARVIDPLKRQIDYSNIIDSTTTSLQARTPGLSLDLPVKRDILGKPQEYGKGLLNVFQQFLSPGFIGKESKDPVVNEINRLYESEGADFLPKARVTNFTDEKVKYNLTTKEISEVQKIMGEYTNKQLSSMINSYEYRNATDAERAKMIKKANETGYDLAKKTIVEARKK